VGSGERLRDPQVRQQKSHGLTGHRRAAIRVDGELTFHYPLPLTGFLDEQPGQGGTLFPGQKPAGNIPAEDVEDHVQVEIAPLNRTEQFGDVPTPHLVWSRGQ